MISVAERKRRQVCVCAEFKHINPLPKYMFGAVGRSVVWDLPKSHNQLYLKVDNKNKCIFFLFFQSANDNRMFRYCTYSNLSPIPCHEE